jgi:hypothetical protein
MVVGALPSILRRTGIDVRLPGTVRQRPVLVEEVRMLNRSRLFGVLLVVLAVSVLVVVGVALATPPPGGTFIDDNGNVHEANIEAIAAAGITKGCNPPTNNRYCPESSVTRGQMAAFLRRAFKLPSSSIDYFVDDNDSIFEGDINAVAAAGITKGCNPPANNRFCPGEKATRGQMAAFLRRTFGYPAASTDYFTDDNGSIFEADINAIAKAGVTKGCNPPTNNRYCPSALVSRDQMASFLARALGLAPITPPPPIGGGECTPDAAPYAVGEMSVSLVDTIRGRSFQTTIYYPATVGGRGAPVSCGPFPMVMAGHGSSGTGESAANLFRFLVADGYIVVGPTFPAGFDYQSLAGDVSFVLDELLAMRSGNGPLGQLDGVNIGFIGTSKGALIGYAMYLGCCVDSRIDAVIPRAGTPPAGPFDYANGPALLILNGDDDPFAPWDQVLAFYHAAQAPKGIIRLAGVGHDLNVGRHGILQDAPRGFFDFILKGDPGGVDEILASVNTNPIASIQFDW